MIFIGILLPIQRKNNFMEKPEATAYRFTVNLLYLLLPYFNISALKKQKYIYMAYRVVESKKRDDLEGGVRT
ncbi:hypothetical protein OL548_29385 [Lysinibacillus sp. MHQ-1]|nr:hypothetical protein OL548_29385 [Lysinibacillus sp. MHQ-1]